MSYTVNCPCGEVAKGDDEDGILAAVTAHVSSAHPEMADTVTRESVLAMATQP
jgi:Protein of unknown function (DUF1059)